MINYRRIVSRLLLILLTGIAPTVSADAGPLTVTINNPARSLVFPNVVTFEGSIRNDGTEAVSFVGADARVSGDGLDLNFNPDFTDLLFGEELPPGSTRLVNIPVFTAQVAPLLITGPYPRVFAGVFEVFGTAGMTDVTGAAAFTVTVAAPVPEPATATLLLLGASGLAASLRRKSRSAMKDVGSV